MPAAVVRRRLEKQLGFALPKLLDFGIAKLAQPELGRSVTRSGAIMGTPIYMSPEQCVANNVDRRTDVFALGVIGHELLTGRRLFKRPSPYETYQAVMECDVKTPSTYDPAVDPALDPADPDRVYLLSAKQLLIFEPEHPAPPAQPSDPVVQAAREALRRSPPAGAVIDGRLRPRCTKVP